MIGKLRDREIQKVNLARVNKNSDAQADSLKSHHNATHLIFSVGIVLCLLLLALLSHRALAAETMTAPFSGGHRHVDRWLNGEGTILIYDGPNLVRSAPDVSFYNGTFALQLNQNAAALMLTRDLRVKVLVDQANGISDTLMTALYQFDPAQEEGFINLVTTIVSAYRDREPATSWEEAGDTVAAKLWSGKCYECLL
jgi:hypothetical protein